MPATAADVGAAVGCPPLPGRLSNRPVLSAPNSLPPTKVVALFCRYHQLRPGQSIIVVEEGGPHLPHKSRGLGRF